MNQIAAVAPEKESDKVHHRSVFRDLWGIVKNQYPDDLQGAKKRSLDFVEGSRWRAMFSPDVYKDIQSEVKRSVTISSMLRYYTILIKKYESPEFQEKILESIKIRRRNRRIRAHKRKELLK